MKLVTRRQPKKKIKEIKYEEAKTINSINDT